MLPLRFAVACLLTTLAAASGIAIPQLQLLTETGQVVGIILATVSVPEFAGYTGTLPQNINFAAKGIYASALLNSTPSPMATLTRDQAIQLAARSVCLVTARGVGSSR